MASFAKPLSLLGITLVVLHTLAIFFIYSQHYEGSWGGLLVFIIDFPVSALALIVVGHYVNFWLASAIIGGAWWYILGFLMANMVQRFRSAKVPSVKAQQPNPRFNTDRFQRPR